ncbi:hypothetical protein Tco_0632477 [Tanacetum coccineum]
MGLENCIIPVTTAKFPILKQGEYDMWRLRIEQYFQVQDYALWDVIENGNLFKPIALNKQMLTRMLRTMLLLLQQVLGLVMIDTKTGLKKTLLKQMYKNFSAPSKSLDFIFNRLQKIISQLAILGINGLIDLYNKFSRFIEQRGFKGTGKSQLKSSSQEYGFCAILLAKEMDLKLALSVAEHMDKMIFQKTSRINSLSNEVTQLDMTIQAGFDWSFMVDDEVPTNMDSLAFLDSEHNQLQKAINTARTNSTVVNAVRANQVNAVKASLPRKNNMYNVDMKNIIPKESLTCLVAKATLAESML